MELALAQIGNSRGVRLSATLIRKHGLDQGILLEDRGHEIVLKRRGGPRKLSLEETYRQMAASEEDWSDWEQAGTEDLEDAPWNYPIPKKVQLWAQASASKERRERAKRNRPGAKRRS